MSVEVHSNYLLAKNSQFLVPFRTSVSIAFGLTFGKHNFFFGLLGRFLLLIHASDCASTPCSLSTTLILSLVVLLRARCISIIALNTLLCGKLLRVQVTNVLVCTVSLLNTLQWMWMALHLFVSGDLLFVGYIWECLMLLRCSNFLLLGYERGWDWHFGLFWSRLAVNCNRIFSRIQCWQFYIRSSSRFHVLIWSCWCLFSGKHRRLLIWLLALRCLDIVWIICCGWIASLPWFEEGSFWLDRLLVLPQAHYFGILLLVLGHDCLLLLLVAGNCHWLSLRCTIFLH